MGQGECEMQNADLRRRMLLAISQIFFKDQMAFNQTKDILPRIAQIVQRIIDGTILLLDNVYGRRLRETLLVSQPIAAGLTAL